MTSIFTSIPPLTLVSILPYQLSSHDYETVPCAEYCFCVLRCWLPGKELWVWVDHAAITPQAWWGSQLSPEGPDLLPPSSLATCSEAALSYLPASPSTQFPSFCCSAVQRSYRPRAVFIPLYSNVSATVVHTSRARPPDNLKWQQKGPTRRQWWDRPGPSWSFDAVERP